MSDGRKPTGRLFNWTEDETILALDLFLQNDMRPLSQTSPQVVELSQLLSDLPIHPLADRPANFRNTNGVARKILNLQYVATGGASGSENGSAVDSIVWDKFGRDVEQVHARARVIREQATTALLIAADGDQQTELIAYEGAARLVLHLRHQRERAIVDRKKNDAKKLTGRLVCEACGFDFVAVYGDVGKDYIECHHIIPIADLKDGQPTRIEDLALVCANCHRMLHRSNPILGIDELRQRITAT